jgi:aspartate/methionine/tyrosine aminotransferase
VAFSLFLKKLLIRTGIARFLPGVQRLTEGGGDFLHYLSDRILTAPLAELRDAAGRLEAHGPDTIDLALGAPRFDLVPSGSTKLPAERRGFPPPVGLYELREAIAQSLFAEQLLSVRPADEVLVTQGAAGAFGVALEALVNRGARVVLFAPASPLYILALRYRGARIRWIETTTENGRLRFRLDRLARGLHRARMIVVNTPANPTGGVIAREDMEQIAWWAKHHDVLIYSDEVYGRYQYEGTTPSIGTLAAARQRSLSAGSVSQSHGLAAARVGWLAGCRHLIRPCTVAAAAQAAFVPTLCQQVALTGLKQSPESFVPIAAEFQSRRRYTFERLQAMGLQPAWPSGAFFLWVLVQPLGLDGRAFADRLLKMKKVLVWPGHHFGPGGAGHIRISYAQEDGRLREGLSRLADLVREIRGDAATAATRQPI